MSAFAEFPGRAMPVTRRAEGGKGKFSAAVGESHQIKGPPFLSVFDQPQREALAYLFVRLHGQGIAIAAIFWGLWLFRFGWLVIRSGFIPRFLGVLLMIAGVAYTVGSFTTLILPHWAPTVGPVAGILEIAEVPIILWLLIWGAKGKVVVTIAG